MKRFIKIVILIIVSLLVITFFVFYTPDRPQDYLEDLYFGEYSNKVELDINSLDNEPLSIHVHYQDLGDIGDPVLVLIHGAFSSSHTFLAWAETLVEHGYRVILPDLPYFGLTGGFEDELTSYRRSGEMIISLLNELDVDTFHVGGNSLGGAVSWYIASEYPERVLSLTLIDAVPASLGQHEQQRVPSFLTTDFFAGIISQMTPKFLVRSILKTAYGNPDMLDEEIFKRYFDLLRRENSRTWILQVKQESEPEFKYQDRLESIEVPTLILWGEMDEWIPVETVDSFVEALSLTEEQIIIYPDLGHVPMEEDPSTVTDYITFLASLS
ncbi:MAG TPA: alpha/beta hydrolase [Acholeplasmataceae bacterium]|nr:alpha/beta hydrolase [Acholeplasmataceae bacterium]